MTLRSLNLKKAYSSEVDDILYEFYIPALQEAIEYDRLAGFFSSTSLAVAATGITSLVENGGVMRLVVSPRLTEVDLQTIIASNRNPLRYLETRLLEDLESLEDEFVRSHVFALGWMLANNRLEMKIAVPFSAQGELLTTEEATSRGLFHPKVGILRDEEGNAVSFSGSINETALGWMGNVEEFKVFRSWQPGEAEYLEADDAKFARFWSDSAYGVQVLGLPQAVRRRLIQIASQDIQSLKLQRLYRKSRHAGICLHQHQLEAVKSWVANEMRGIFDMATGVGKTFAALGCLERVYRLDAATVAIVACPQQHLLQQWKNEISRFGISCDDLIFADSSHAGWRDTLADALRDLSFGYKSRLLVLTTHRTLSADDFVRIIKSSQDATKTLLIADEVHGVGAQKTKQALLDEYEFRLGLSATPRRWFDPIGTRAIYDYFGGVVYDFGLQDALSTINPATGLTYLTPYRYSPRFVALTYEELDDYLQKTRSIARSFYSQDDEDSRAEILDTLRFQRANIVKNAVEKYDVLRDLLSEMGPSLQWTIIYCSPQQIDEVMQIVNEYDLFAHRFTMDEGTTPQSEYGGRSQREYILERFAEGRYQVLVAMKCLDQGVDVPPARTAILMASSGNPREYIQRIGRIVRRHPGKTEATIHDIVVVPSLALLPPELRDLEKRIFESELTRCEEIASHALNSAEALKLLYTIRRSLLEGRR